MQKYNFFLLPLFALLFFLPLVLQAQGKSPAGKDIYFKYEDENVDIFRDRVDFKLPEPNVVILEPQKGGLDPDSLSGYFVDGKKLHIQADPMLEEWIRRDSVIKNKMTDVQGFRIQVYAGTNRRSAFSVKGSLISRFPDYSAYLEYKSPNYVVRIGDFLEREDAILFQKIIRESFPGAFIVPDLVKVPKYDPEWEKKLDEKEEPFEDWSSEKD